MIPVMVDAGARRSPIDPRRIILDSRTEGLQPPATLARWGRARRCLQAGVGLNYRYKIDKKQNRQMPTPRPPPAKTHHTSAVAFRAVRVFGIKRRYPIVETTAPEFPHLSCARRRGPSGTRSDRSGITRCGRRKMRIQTEGIRRPSFEAAAETVLSSDAARVAPDAKRAAMAAFIASSIRSLL